ncbi:MAG: hypothetical protein P8P74_06775 [Crocinitomicaceae bacterium]|nr:hypothetical protein [Crocinitomicaceae bacterium]
MKQLILLIILLISAGTGFSQSHRAGSPIYMNDFVINETSEKGSLAWFYPRHTPKTAQQLEKVEFGISLPKTVMEKVNAFLSAEGVTDMGLNPFDRNDIDIEATFTHNGKIVKRNEAFYFTEFRRDLGNNRWWQDTTSYNFRIRHAPEFTGEYKVDVRIDIRGLETISVNSEFVVQASDNPGFLESGKYKKHMRFSKTKETFVGVGQVIPWVFDNSGQLDEAAGPVSFMVMYNSFRKLKQSGGNFTRMVAAPWFLQLEWESLGNYEPKMGQAWEFDRMNDKLQELDVYFIFCALLHSPFESHPGEGAPNQEISWESYCYNQMDLTKSETACEPDVLCTEPVDFFDNEVALNHQKNYFRYFVARWGYSTSVAGWQLISETDQLHNYRDERVEDGTMIDHSENRAKVNKWVDEISSFMASECDDQHLKSTSLITGRNYSSYMWDPALFELEHINFVGQHDYVFEMEPSQQNVRNRNLLRRYNSVNNLGIGLEQGEITHPKYQKNMFIYDEFGHVPVIPRAYPEDKDDDPVVAFNSCADFSFKQDLWFTFASGCAVAGLDWWNEHDRNRHAMWKRYFPGMNKFKEDIDFETVNYTKVREAKGETYIAQRWPLRRKDITRSNNDSYRKSDLLEAYIQVDSLDQQGFGWMMNRSFHWGNLVDSLSCISDLAKGEGEFARPYLYNPMDDDEVAKPITIEENEAFIRVYKVKPRTEFTIDFYDTESGEIIKTVETRSSLFGTLKIVSPEMKPSERYDLAFKFYDSGLGWR